MASTASATGAIPHSLTIGNQALGCARQVAVKKLRLRQALGQHRLAHPPWPGQPDDGGVPLACGQPCLQKGRSIMQADFTFRRLFVGSECPRRSWRGAPRNRSRNALPTRTLPGLLRLPRRAQTPGVGSGGMSRRSPLESVEDRRARLARSDPTTGHAAAASGVASLRRLRVAWRGVVGHCRGRESHMVPRGRNNRSGALRG